MAVSGAPPGLAKVRHLARHQVMGLTGAFLVYGSLLTRFGPLTADRVTSRARDAGNLRRLGGAAQPRHWSEPLPA